jgi:hypothetical protein
VNATGCAGFRHHGDAVGARESIMLSGERRTIPVLHRAESHYRVL